MEPANYPLKIRQGVGVHKRMTYRVGPDRVVAQLAGWTGKVEIKGVDLDVPVTLTNVAPNIEFTITPEQTDDITVLRSHWRLLLTPGVGSPIELLTGECEVERW